MMNKKLTILFLLTAFGISAQDLTQNYRKYILNSPNTISLFQANSTNGIWASGMITADRWGIFEDATSSKEHFTVLPGGNVGIGDATPSKKLDVNGTIGAQDFIVVQTGGSYKVALNGQSHGYITGRNSSFSNKFYITSNGNSYLNGGKVGIGTTSPTQLLELYDNVNGAVNLGVYNHSTGSNSRAGIKFGMGNNYDKGTELYFQRANNTFYFSNVGDPNSNFLFRTRNASGTFVEAMKINPDGHVGIGTANPGSYKLAVNGHIRAKEIKVETGWADYVFHDNYDLPSLDEVEQHIKEKGHLINIPSAKEVEENGVQLGEMNKLLLEKIEELTLYTLQQQKEIEEANNLKVEFELLKNSYGLLLKRIEELENK